jgi:sugar transferase EpsL
MDKPYASTFKRIFDLALTVLSLPFWLPLLLIVGLAIRIVLGGPVFFKQKRGGYKMEPFYILKFRSMTDERDEDGELLPDDRRLGKFGKFLRSASLDELPSLLQVLSGQISLVGPRPHIYDYVEFYTERQKRRFLVRPGITGWAQVRGRNSISWDERYELDIEYVENISFFFDLKILVLTVLKIFSTSDVNSKDHATMERFTGSAKQSKRSGNDAS